MTSNIETNLKFSFEKLCEVAKENSHEHGWGVAWLENNKLRLEKDKESIWDSERARTLLRDIRSKLIVVHARKNSNQKPLKVRSHPFLNKALGEQWIFAHNGTIECPEPINHTPKSDVDSERFFCYFLDLLEQINDRCQFEKEEELVLAALRKSMEKTKIVTALNFILASKHNLYVARLYKANPDYYTLKHLTRSWKSEVAEKVGKSPGEAATVFSSEDLSKEPWTPLANGEIGIVPVGLPEKLRRTQV
jgi:glutamine amidotransferase